MYIFLIYSISRSQVAGDANEDQIMAALMHYTDKAELLGYTLKNLYNILRHTEYKRQDEAIEVNIF